MFTIFFPGKSVCVRVVGETFIKHRMGNKNCVKLRKLYLMSTIVVSHIRTETRFLFVMADYGFQFLTPRLWQYLETAHNEFAYCLQIIMSIILECKQYRVRSGTAKSLFNLHVKESSSNIISSLCYVNDIIV